ncbi:MAG: dihydroorotase [Candidatus Saganbacteria bacterium]|nr:dihydroorotase [Candidatus Saganbacteria bacterium]
MTRILIKGGRVIDPANNTDEVKDILIEDGKIVAGHGSRVTGQEVIEAKGKWVLPGLIDMHAHLRDPGRPDKETIASGSRAAALGGFTTVCCMANTNPPVDNPAVVEYVVAKAAREAVVNVRPIAAVTKGLKGEELAEMGRCRAEGAVAFSDDGQPVMRADLMRRALEYAKQFAVPIISHCEDSNLSADGVMNEGALSTEIGLPGVSHLAEEIMVARDIMLARQFGLVHLAHISTAGAVRLVRQAKVEGVPVTCETCPHYFSLTEAAVKEYDTNAKVNPPLRSAGDVTAVVQGLKDGTIDVIATDHAPHTLEEKTIEFSLAKSGLVGLETALALVITKLIIPNVLSPAQAVEKLAAAPARILNLAGKGSLRPGSDADLIVVDPHAEWTVDAAKFASKGRNTPFSGWTLKGRVLQTIVGGKIVVRDGKLVA